eukprot:scaffold442_cov268-Pinguiococcus_pyrenoidosus.AAC.114
MRSVVLVCIVLFHGLPVSGFAPARRGRTETARGVAEEAATSSGRSAPTQEIQRRRTLAIISHPDAGKTTLTEQLLLQGGAINQAGVVRARGDARRATSDWMKMEQERGISVTSTVLTFDYQRFRINLLDTPGHEDFGEDTYRTLSAADNSVMLIDGAKGLEPRTRKLFEVCRLRRLPIFTFCNKMDRPAMDPFDILDQIEGEFSIQCAPVLWPIGSGDLFQGVLDRNEGMVHVFQRTPRGQKPGDPVAIPLDDAERLPEQIGEEAYEKLLEDVDLLDGLYEPVDLDKVASGEQTPVFFGSAFNNFGVDLFVKHFVEMGFAPPTRKAHTNPDSEVDTVILDPEYPEFTAQVFKLQANMDPKHRDRVAFVRVMSGSFERGMKVTLARTGRSVRLNQAQNIFGQGRETIDEAFPGDVLGLNNPGEFEIGDTIYSGGKDKAVQFPPIPCFSPERFMYIRNPDPSKYKPFRKGVVELLNEGAVQLLRERGEDGMPGQNPILAAVGQLQFDVVQARLLNEYGCASSLEPVAGYSVARWALGGWEAVDKARTKLMGVLQTQDRWGRPVLLFATSSLRPATDGNEEVILLPAAIASSFEPEARPAAFVASPSEDVILALCCHATVITGDGAVRRRCRSRMHRQCHDARKPVGALREGCRCLVSRIHIPGALHRLRRLCRPLGNRRIDPQSLLRGLGASRKGCHRPPAALGRLPLAILGQFTALHMGDGSAEDGDPRRSVAMYIRVQNANASSGVGDAGSFAGTDARAVHVRSAPGADEDAAGLRIHNG